MIPDTLTSRTVRIERNSDTRGRAARKSAKAVVRTRVEAVLELRLDGARLPDIRRYAAEQEPPWTVSDRQLERYIEAADRLQEKSVEVDRVKLLNKHLARRERLFQIATKNGDVRAALAALKDAAELTNLYPAKRRELTGANGEPLQSQATCVPMTEEQKQRGIAAIAACLARMGYITAAPEIGEQLDPPGLPGSETETPDTGDGDDSEEPLAFDLGLRR